MDDLIDTAGTVVNAANAMIDMGQRKCMPAAIMEFFQALH